MRLATIRTGGSEIPALAIPGRGLVPLRTVWSGAPATLLALLEDGLDAARCAELSAAAAELADVDFIDPATADYGPPYRRPRKLWGIGLNYRAHADDLSAPYPDEPASFMKGDHTIIGPGEPILLPPQSRRVTAEAELGVVIGRECRQVEEADALEYVAAVCPVLDQTAEDILERNPRFLTRSKNFPTFFSFGPELVTLDEVLERFGSLDAVVVATCRNGGLHRENPVSDMTFSPAYLVAFHSQVMPLYPGDIIATGTPGAVEINDGDSAECRIEGIGTLANPVRRLQADRTSS